MEGKSSFFNIVLLFILAFLSLTLAALAAYVFLGGGGSAKAPSNINQTVDPGIPKDDELTEISLFGEGDTPYFNLKNSDIKSTSIPVIQVIIKIKYFKQVKDSSVKDTSAKINSYISEMKAMVTDYFLNLTPEDAKTNPVQAKERAAKILKQKMNELLNVNEKEKKDIIYNIIIEKWFVAA